MQGTILLSCWWIRKVIAFTEGWEAQILSQYQCIQSLDDSRYDFKQGSLVIRSTIHEIESW